MKPGEAVRQEGHLQVVRPRESEGVLRGEPEVRLRKGGS